MKNKMVWVVNLILLCFSVQLQAQQCLSPYIEAEFQWLAYESTEKAGFDPARLETARQHFENLDSASCFVVYKGKVLASWGDATAKYLTHSARKSFCSALFGIYAAAGTIDLNKTLAELGIDDSPPLTSDEKRARIIDLLKARSGVYHTAAAENAAMHDYKPDRGSYAPDEHWCYNNWDFNTLCTIFRQETGEDFFQALEEKIFTPLGMEDWQAGDGQYYYQNERSQHPAYHFAMSARDAARFGLLFLNEGKWQGKEILPVKWIMESSFAWSDSSDYIPDTNYGIMWWVMKKGWKDSAGLEHLSRYKSYAALGAYGQVILVIPEAELVFVHRVDSYNRHNVRLDDIWRLVDMIIAAKLESDEPLQGAVAHYFRIVIKSFKNTPASELF